MQNAKGEKRNGVLRGVLPAHLESFVRVGVRIAEMADQPVRIQPEQPLIADVPPETTVLDGLLKPVVPVLDEHTPPRLREIGAA